VEGFLRFSGLAWITDWMVARNILLFHILYFTSMMWVCICKYQLRVVYYIDTQNHAGLRSDCALSIEDDHTTSLFSFRRLVVLDLENHHHFSSSS
jgi:hypothetical protein